MDDQSSSKPRDVIQRARSILKPDSAEMDPQIRMMMAKMRGKVNGLEFILALELGDAVSVAQDEANELNDLVERLQGKLKNTEVVTKSA